MQHLEETSPLYYKIDVRVKRLETTFRSSKEKQFEIVYEPKIWWWRDNNAVTWFSAETQLMEAKTVFFCLSCSGVTCIYLKGWESSNGGTWLCFCSVYPPRYQTNKHVTVTHGERAQRCCLCMFWISSGCFSSSGRRQLGHIHWKCNLKENYILGNCLFTAFCRKSPTFGRAKCLIGFLFNI